MAMPGNTADTFLVHFFGSGLLDEKYVFEPFKVQGIHADSDIRSWPGEPGQAVDVWLGQAPQRCG